MSSIDKAVYVNTDTLNGIMFPNKKMVLTPNLIKIGNINSYLSKIFSTRLSYFNHNSFRPEDDITGQYTPIVSKLILTNPDRTGIYLHVDPKTLKVSIPGGYVMGEDIQYVMEELGDVDGLVVLREALIRKLYSEFNNPSVGESMYESSKITSRTHLERICDVVYPKISTVEFLHGEDELYYSYKIPNNPMERSLTFYHVLTVAPHSFNDGIIPMIPRNLLWLCSADWRVSRRCKNYWDKESIIGECVGPVGTDIRFSDKYSPILDTVFNTNELF